MRRLMTATEQGFAAWQNYVARLNGECLPGRDMAAAMLAAAANQRRNVADELREGRRNDAFYSAGVHVRYILAARRARKESRELP